MGDHNNIVINQRDFESSSKSEMAKEESGGGGGGGGGDQLYLLPEGCIANVLSFTGPRDACRLSAVSSLFRSAAESDTVWERFLPTDYQSIISSHSSSFSKKQLFLYLCRNPILIDNGRKSFSLDKWSGKKCYMLSARDLMIVWSDTPAYWTWTSDPTSRFEEVAELTGVCWLEIRGKIRTFMLSPGTLYAACLVFKSTTRAYGFEYQPVEVAVGLVGSESCSQSVYLDLERSRGLRLQNVRRRSGLFNLSRRFLGLQTQTAVPSTTRSHGECPKDRGDGWLEIELGEFFTKEGEDGELEMSLLEGKGGNWKGGLIVQGIEIRPKEGK